MGALTVERGQGERTVLPPDDLDTLLDLARFLDAHDKPARLVGPEGNAVALPAPVYDVLVQVVEALRAGRAITVAPLAQRLTTQEAADLLGVSRPTLVKLLESGAIPYEQPGRHRRVRLVDLLTYRDARRNERRATLNRMTEEAGEAGIYEGSPEDYAAALKAARKRRAK
jgi:excisionase family DNA binding protein